MWYVYAKHLRSGKTECVHRTFDTPQAAVKHIAICYSVDKGLRQLGEYYYYMKEH